MSGRNTAAAVQFEPTLFAKEQNIAALVELVEEAADNGARLITTPEMATTGYCLFDHDEAATMVEPVPGPTTERFAAVAAARNCYIMLGMPETDGSSGLFYNSAVLIGPDGVAGRHHRPAVEGPPVGATGVGQVVELTRQLHGQARDRQVTGASVALAHTVGAGVATLDAIASGVVVLTT